MDLIIYIVVVFNLSENHYVAVGVSFGTAHDHLLKLYNKRTRKWNIAGYALVDAKLHNIVMHKELSLHTLFP